MKSKFLRACLLGAAFSAPLGAFYGQAAFAQVAPGAAPSAGASGESAAHTEAPGGGVFDAKEGTWFHGLANAVVPKFNQAIGVPTKTDAGGGVSVKYDYLVITPLLWLLLAVALVSAARKVRIRPGGKVTSSANVAEAAVAGFQDYLIGVMGNTLARKYTPLIASFFFTILVSNWLGLIPGMLAPSSAPVIPITLAIVAFVCVHVIAIREAGLKSWFMHFVGEPWWLAWLNFPLHVVGELIKPLSLSLRLLCNVFGEEAVVATLVGLAIAFLPTWLPIPFQIPMLLLGTFFGFLQALVFSTLLAIYISIFATHHDSHDHASTEHATDLEGHGHLVAHPGEATVGA